MTLVTATAMAWPGVSHGSDTLYRRKGRLMVMQQPRTFNMHGVRKQEEEDDDGNGIEGQYKRRSPHFSVLVSSCCY